MKKFLIPIFAVTLLLVGCSDTEDPIGNGENYEYGSAATFTATLEPRENSSTSESWNTGDQFGVFIFEKNSVLAWGDYQNVCYTYDGSSTLSATTTAYYPANEEEVIDFLVYYPYSAAVSNYTYSIDVTDQSDESAIDLRVASNATGYSESTSAAELKFTHSMAKIVMNLTASSSLGDVSLAGVEVKLNDVATKASYNLIKEQYDEITATGDIIALTQADGSKSSVIMIPDTQLFSFDLTLSTGVSLTWEAGEALTMKAGYEYQLNVSFGPSGIVVESITINSWGGLDSEVIEGDGDLIWSAGVSSYAVGDLYPDDINPIGVVFEISNGGLNGKVVALVEEMDRWGDTSIYETDNDPICSDNDDGKAITQAIILARKDGGNFEEWGYNLFHWLYTELNGSDLYGDWYMPAKHELMSLVAAISGYTYADIESSWSDDITMPNYNNSESADAREAFNAVITSAGGTEINLSGNYWASTEISMANVWRVQLDTGTLDGTQDKWNSWDTYLRPIMQF